MRQTQPLDLPFAPSAQAHGPMVEIVEGPGAGQTFPIGPTTLIVGSDGAADVVLADDDEVSSAHAGFICWKGDPRVCAFETRTGVRVNGRRVTEATLEDGDEVTIGSSVFRIRAG